MKKITKSISAIFIAIIFLASCGGSGNKEQHDDNGQDTSKAKTPAKVNVDEAITINSFDLAEAFRKDRSIAWKKYGDKSLLITDILVYDVYNVEFSKKATAFPYSPAQKICGFYSNDRMFTFKGEPISNNDVIFQFNLSLASPEEMDKVGMLDYEAVVDNDFKKTISMYAVLNGCDFSKKEGEADNLKTNWCHLNFEACDIVSDKKK